jgi:SAM-dependent methyltransferase
MGRTTNQGLEPVELQPLDDEMLRTTQNRMAVMTVEQDATVRGVAEQLGYQLPADCTDPDLIQRDIAANMRRSVEACLEVGRGLQVLKAACGHGQFIARLEVLGLEPSVAQRFMQTAAKFASRSAPVLKAIGNQSKLFEMLILDDEQVEELELTGQTGELKLDDIATMSVKELRKALREAREDKEALGKHLAEKNAKLDELATSLDKTRRQVQAMTADDRAKALRQEVAALAYEAETDITGKLREGFAKLAEHAIEHGVDHRVFQATLVHQLETLLASIRTEFHLPDEIDPETAPEWLTADVDSLVTGQPGA